MRKNKILVIAGNYSEYFSFKRENPNVDSKYINIIHDMYGYSDTTLIIYGNSHMRCKKDLDMIFRYCVSHNINIEGEFKF